MQNEMEQSDITSLNFVRGDFEYELGALFICMMVEIKVILAPFLAFASTYIVAKVHNMLEIMLDPTVQILGYFKSICWKGQGYTHGGKI
jgi:hypothetical protein